MEKDHVIIVAHDQVFGIGRANKLPWHIKSDLKFFQKTTSEVPPDVLQGGSKQNALIMGRNTWQSLPEAYRPLSKRQNIVLTTNDSFFLPEGVFRARSFTEAMQSISADNPKIFVIGGASVYKEAINMDTFGTLHVTEVEGIYACDTFFPEYKSIFELVESSPLQIESNYRFRFKTYARKK